jgi:hypothetical protein
VALFFSQLGCFIKFKEEPRLPAVLARRTGFLQTLLYCGCGLWHMASQRLGFLLSDMVDAKGIPVGDGWIAFREVVSGPLDHGAFIRRAMETP